MNLTDVTPAMVATGGAGAAGRRDMAALADRPQAHTLQKAAKLTGISAGDLRNDTGSNIKGGAALLADYQKQVTGKLSSRPSDWTAAVARYSQVSDRKAAKTSQTTSSRPSGTAARAGSRATRPCTWTPNRPCRSPSPFWPSCT